MLFNLTRHLPHLTSNWCSTPRQSLTLHTHEASILPCTSNKISETCLVQICQNFSFSSPRQPQRIVPPANPLHECLHPDVPPAPNPARPRHQRHRGLPLPSLATDDRAPVRYVPSRRDAARVPSAAHSTGHQNHPSSKSPRADQNLDLEKLSRVDTLPRPILLHQTGRTK